MAVTLEASSNVLLSPLPSALQAVAILGLVGLVVLREALRQVEPVPLLAQRVARLVRLLTPVVLLLLVLRLLVILQ